MKEHTAIPVGGNILSYILTFVQTNEIFQVVSFGLSIVTSLIIIGYKIWSWYREAKKDGKITKEEVKNLADDISDDVKELNDKVKGDKKNG